MTTNQTLRALRRAGKIIGVTRLYHFLNKLGIEPLGVRQRPQQYPADTAERILQHLGFSAVPQYTDADAFPAKKLSAVPPKGKGRVTPPNTNGRAAEIVSLKQLKRERKNT